MNRRELLGLIPAGALLAADVDLPGKPAARLYDVTRFGAVADGKTLATEGINRAIDACYTAGGGVVYLPPGVYLSGTVVLRSNVTLYLEAGAVLRGSARLSDYTPQPGPPPDTDANQRHLLFARSADNIGLAGPGRIDGQGPCYWAPSKRIPPKPEDAWSDVATFDWTPLPRPSPMIELVACRNVRVEGVRITNSPGWTLRPINCDDVVIEGVRIENPIIGPNTDGIDITGCRNVFISNCVIETADDAICLKSENPYGEAVRLNRNILVTNCVLSCCCNGFKVGTGTQGGFENITFSNSIICSESSDLARRPISGIALEMVDGGWLEGVTISNIRMQNVRTPIFLRRGKRRSRPDGSAGTLRGVMIDGVHATGSILTSSIAGIPGAPVEDISLTNIRIDSDEAGLPEWGALLVPELESSYPEARMFGRLPSYALYCRHVAGLRLRSVDFRATRSDARPALVCDNVMDLDIDGFRSAGATAPSAIRLVDTRSALIRAARTQGQIARTVEIAGENSKDIDVFDR